MSGTCFFYKRSESLVVGLSRCAHMVLGADALRKGPSFPKYGLKGLLYLLKLLKPGQRILDMPHGSFRSRLAAGLSSVSALLKALFASIR